MLDDHKVETNATVRLAPGSYASANAEEGGYGYYGQDEGIQECTECAAGFYNDEPGAELEMGVPVKNLCNQLGVQRFLKLMPWIVI